MGGRGITNLAELHARQINIIKKYFMRKKDESRLHNIIFKTDKAYTAANLFSNEEYKVRDRTTKDRLEQWKQKALNGRYPTEIEKEYIDKKASLMWLQKVYLYPETEGFIMAIQNDVI